MPAPLWTLPEGWADAPLVPTLGFDTCASLASEGAREAREVALSEALATPPVLPWGALMFAAGWALLGAAKRESARARATLLEVCERAHGAAARIETEASMVRATIKARIGKVSTASVQACDAYREASPKQGLLSRLFGFGGFGPRGEPLDTVLEALHGDGLALACDSPDDLVGLLLGQNIRSASLEAARGEAAHYAELEAADVDAAICARLDLDSYCAEVPF